ncbi:hypothetical protein [Umezawaea beigongshangensis]|uniref:hypothetical protein n=1 Tax=Umezawaea beigongshangensis TaxID=2780383 RepID=UPI0018F1BAAF|nr:hypothetical protein [Umezawaea beigongshangensis]
MARDGIGEFLDDLPRAPRTGRPAEAAGRVLEPREDTGPRWTVEFGTWTRPPGAGAADVVVRGSAVELYLFLHGRAPAPLVTGNAALLARWSEATRF